MSEKEETNGVTPSVHESPIESEAVDASGVEGGVTADGAFVPGDAQTDGEVEDNAADSATPTVENTDHSNDADSTAAEEETE